MILSGHRAARDADGRQVAYHQGPSASRSHPLRDFQHQPSIPIAYLQLLVEILGERGISAAQLLHEQPLDPALLDDSQARMSPLQWTRLVLRAQALTDDPGLGYEYGLRMRPTVHGVLGYAAMSSASLRQAQEISARYNRLRQAGFSFEFHEDDDVGYLSLIQRQPIPVARAFFIENILLGLAGATAVLLGRTLAELPDLEIWFDMPEPPYYAAWAARLPTLRFNQRGNLLRLPAHYLSLRPVLADPLASQQAIALCERELALAAGQDSDIIAHVRAALVPQDGGGYPTLAALCAPLHISSRTLKRRLQQQGTSYLLLLEEARQQDARRWLAHSPLPVRDIATRLGYDNPANFTRAFRRWTGETPSDYRERHRS